MHEHLFICTSNGSGSTILHNLFAACERVAHLGCEFKNDGSYFLNEGHHLVLDCLPNVYRRKQGAIWTEAIGEIKNEKNYNWPQIKKIWYQKWSEHPAYNYRDCLLVEKSPQNLGRIEILQKEFPEAYFIVQVRNPYAVAEGVDRRNEHVNVERGMYHACNVLNLAYCAINEYKVKNLLVWRYEDFPGNKDIENLIKDTIPHIDDFDINYSSPVHSIDGIVNRGSINLNESQLSRLDNTKLEIMDKVADNYKCSMRFFGYE